jgi:hypothetical protein
LGNVLIGKSAVAVLVDNLDKGWERRSDLSALSRLLLGLLSVIGRVEKSFKRGPSERREDLRVHLALFLRSDIYAYVAAEEAREPDKINVRSVEWSDPEVLVSVIEQRFLASRPEGAKPDELWTTYFAPTVKGIATKDYILSRVLPRPRDLIYFANACVRVAIDRSHDRIEEPDVIEAETLYSQFAFEALLVENGITIDELESVVFEFAAGPAILEESDVLAKISSVGLEGMRVEQVLRRLKQMSFLGLVTGGGKVEYPESGREAERAEVLARKHAEGPGTEKVVVHPAFRSYLAIADPK